MKPMLIAEAAEYVRISPDSLREMAERGDAPAAKIGPNGGRVWIFTDESLDEFVRQEIARQTAERREAKGVAPALQPPAERGAFGRRRPRTPPALNCVTR